MSTKEKKKEYNRQYRLDNKEKIKEYNRKYKLNNKEKINNKNKQYWLDNNKKIKEKQKQYYQTPVGKKNRVVAHWKQRGIIDEDLPSVYDYLIKQTNCMICLKEFKSTQDRHLDHDHSIPDAPNIRYICCNHCNTKLLAEKYIN